MAKGTVSQVLHITDLLFGINTLQEALESYLVVSDYTDVAKEEQKPKPLFSPFSNMDYCLVFMVCNPVTFSSQL